MIYFIQAGKEGPVKIGYSKNVESRLNTLQTGHYEQLHLLLSFPGDMTREAELHEQFKADRLHGEWFNWSDNIQKFYENIQSGFHCNGKTYPTRLEAQWSLFFDAMGWKYEYDKSYFHLTEIDAYIRVTEAPPTKLEQSNANVMSMVKEALVFVVTGLPKNKTDICFNATSKPYVCWAEEHTMQNAIHTNNNRIHVKCLYCNTPHPMIFNPGAKNGAAADLIDINQATMIMGCPGCGCHAIFGDDSGLKIGRAFYIRWFIFFTAPFHIFSDSLNDSVSKNINYCSFDKAANSVEITSQT